MRRQHFQRGFLLESLGLVLLILSLLALLQMNKKFEEELDNEATRRGQALATVRNVANEYLMSYSDQLLMLNDKDAPMVATNGGLTVTIEHGWYPTIQNLIDLGKAPPNMSSKAIGGGEYVIKIFKPKEVCQGLGCHLDGLVYIKPDDSMNGKPIDYPRLGISAAVIGADGGFSRLKTPLEMSGYNNGWHTDNDERTSGILGARFGFYSSEFAKFYKRDGSLPLTGALAGGHQAINEVTTINASGKVTGGSFRTDDFNVDAPCVEGDKHAFGSGTSGSMMVCLENKWVNALHNPVEPGSDCAMNGVTGTSLQTHETLICKKGKFIRLDKLLGNRIVVGRETVWNGKLVDKPSCESNGSEDYSIIPIETVTDLSEDLPRTLFHMTTEDLDTKWVVRITLRDPAGNEYQTGKEKIKAIMNLECVY